MNNACRICLEAADVGDYQAGGGRGVGQPSCSDVMVPILADANDDKHVAVCSCQVQAVQGLKVRSVLYTTLYHSMPLSDL